MIITLKGANFSANNIGNIDIPDIPGGGGSTDDTTSVINQIFNNMAWTIGKTPGAEQPGLYLIDARYVCMDVPYNTNGETISINNPNTNLYQCNVNICNADGSFNRYDVNQLSSATWTMNGNIRLCMKFKDNRDMTEELWQTMKAEILAANE